MSTFALSLVLLFAPSDEEAEVAAVQAAMQARALARQVGDAVKRYGLDDAQAANLKKLLQERNALDRLKSAAVQAHYDAAAAPEKPEGSDGSSDDKSDDPEAAGKRLELRRRGRELFAEVMRHRAETGELVRATLDERQRALFDADLAAGAGPFPGLSEEPEPRATADRRGTPGEPAVPVKRFTGRGFLEREWAAYLAALGVEAGMDAAQRDKTIAMYKSAVEAAAEYRRLKERDYAQLAKALANAPQPPDPQRRAELEAAARLLSAPLESIFEKLKSDADSLLSDSQRAKVKSSRHPLLRSANR